MRLTDTQLAVLRAIDATDEISAEAATWAVKEGLAVQAEDGDIALTPVGKDILATDAD